MGTFAAAGAATICAACNPGSINTNVGASSCRQCMPGTFAASATACNMCAAGKFADSAGATLCANCVAGTYTPGTGYQGCLTCPAGTFSNTTAAACTVCAVGLWSLPGATVCNNCTTLRPNTSIGQAQCATVNSATCIDANYTCLAVPVYIQSNTERWELGSGIRYFFWSMVGALGLVVIISFAMFTYWLYKRPTRYASV